VIVSDSERWLQNDYLLVWDSTNNETAQISSIDYASHNITLTGALSNNYNTNNNASLILWGVSDSIFQIGGYSPATGLAPHDASGRPWGVYADTLHLYSPRHTTYQSLGNGTDAEEWDCQYAVYASVAGFTVSHLDLEGVYAKECLLYNDGSIVIDYLEHGDAPDMLAPITTGTSIRITHGSAMKLTDMINLNTSEYQTGSSTWAGVWNSTDHGTEISAYVYVPNATILSSGNNIYYLYNKWMQYGGYFWGWTKTNTLVRLEPMWELPANITAYAYDDDKSANHRLAIVIVNESGEDFTVVDGRLIFWLKIL